MTSGFKTMLSVGGKSNSLGKASEIFEMVIEDQTRMAELYECVFDENAWVRMRAIDTIEKICRVHPEWLQAYVDRFNQDISTSKQPSVQWHLAQMYGQIKLTNAQQAFAINWLSTILSSKDIDWIVSANSMKTLVRFTDNGDISRSKTLQLLKIQQKHSSKSVAKLATRLMEEL